MGNDPERAPSTERWREVAVLVVLAIATLVGADVGLRRLNPPKYVREVQDAMRDYPHEDPSVLVLGSSHARSFNVMNGIARARTGGRVRILDVPLEWGKFRSYEWVLHHRVEPFVEEKEGGQLKRPSLKHFILLTAWWDGVWYDGDPPVFNLPSRAWTLADFVSALASEGLSDHSRNYVTSRWLELWHGSIFVSDRGYGHLLSALRDRVKPLSDEAKEDQLQMRLESWRGIMKRGASGIGHPAELAAADRILGWAQARGYDTTLMLYPMMPLTVTEKWRTGVQAPFAASMKDLASRRGIRFIDTTLEHNLTDADFQPDFDHLTPSGHEKFSNWLLSGHLRFLLDEAPSDAGAALKGAGGTL